MTNSIEKTVSISAPPSVVWEALTNPDLMKQWMADPEVGLDINTNWTIGSPILIKGFLHKTFENKGTILQFEVAKLPGVKVYDSLVNLSLCVHHERTILHNRLVDGLTAQDQKLSL